MTSSAGITSHKVRLTQKRRQEQDIHHYVPSSRWYTYLSNAISYIDLAETSAGALDRFRNCWSAIYNLYMMMHQAGDAENITLSRWTGEIEKAPMVRSICQQLPPDLLNNLLRAQNTLLKDAERNRWRDSKAYIETWQQKRQQLQELSAEKACTYTFFIGRDLRNAVSHPTINPNAAATRRALEAAAEVFLSLAVAAIEATIDHPPMHSTGRATAYRSFLYPFLKNSDGFFSDYYLKEVFEQQELESVTDEAAKAGLKQLDRELNARQTALRTADDIDPTRQQWYEPVLFPALGMTPQLGCRLVSEEGVFEPSYILPRSEFSGALPEEYVGKTAKQDLACLIWVLPWRIQSLDVVSEHPDFPGLTAMEVAQRALLSSDVPWAILTNGQRLRLLSKGTAHKPRCFLEVDLAAMIDRRGDREGKLAYRYLLGLFSGASFTEADDKGRTQLDRVLEGSDRYGQEISDELKQNVFKALEELGEGILYYLRAHPEALESYPTSYILEPTPSDNLLTDVYQESLSLMYRLLFLFYAESRDLLPMENEVYRDSYSLEALRDDVRATHDDPDPKSFFSKGATVLWERLQELFGLVNTGTTGIGIPSYNGGLFDPGQHPFLENLKVGDYFIARAIDLLSRTRPSSNRPKGEGRKKVTYRDLDIRHLGSIYEGILEYSAHIAGEVLVILRRGSSGKTYEEYVPISELKLEEAQQLAAWRTAIEEDEEDLKSPRLPRGCKVTGVKTAGSYFLVYGGRESKRKSSGSYYTPDYIVQYIIENTLGPLVRGENREGELKDVQLTPEEILDLKVLDPAMGSAHFLVAATEFLARAYGEAMIRAGRDIDGVISEDEFIRYKRMVAERCIYGVDANLMAVELAKLSMWLFTMDKNRPLSFLNHHLKCGNALIGAWIEDLGDLPEFDRSGKPKKRRKARTGENLFEHHFRARVPTMIGNVFQIMQQETETYQDVEAKKALDQGIEELKRPFKNVADMWVGTFFGEQPRDYYSLLTDIDRARIYSSPTAKERKFFCWELEFPEIWFDTLGRHLDSPGFDAVLGNPPYYLLQGHEDQSIMEGLHPDFHTGSDDILYYFIRQKIHLIKSNGKGSYIVSRYWTESYHADNLRKFIALNCDVEKLVDFRNFQPFGAEIGILCCILFIRKAKVNSTAEILRFEDFFVGDNSEATKALNSSVEFNKSTPNSFCKFTLPQSCFDKSSWHISPQEVESLIDHISNGAEVLGDMMLQTQGVKTGLNHAFIVPTDYASQFDLEQELLLGLVKGKDIFPFNLASIQSLLIYTHDGIDIENYPNIYRHLSKYRDQLEKRAECRDGDYPWWRLQRPRNSEIVLSSKILTPIYATFNRFGLSVDIPYAVGVTDTNSFCIRKDSSFSIFYISAILNSSIGQFFHKRRSKLKRANYYEYFVEDLKKFPIPHTSRNETASKKLIGLVEEILQENYNTSKWIEYYEEIDDLVFSIYGFGKLDRQLIKVLSKGFAEV